MRELALHLLDVLENAVRAQATVIQVSIVLDTAENRLTLSVDDDGPGLSVRPEDAMNPFYTTKHGKRTGLGLSLFRAAAELASGSFSISGSELGGVNVTATFEYTHLDRAPLGDVGETVKTLAVSNPEIVWICHVNGPGGEETLMLQDLVLENPDMQLFALLENFACRIRDALAKAGIGLE